jgi:hypothetical protein
MLGVFDPALCRVAEKTTMAGSVSRLVAPYLDIELRIGPPS